MVRNQRAAALGAVAAAAALASAPAMAQAGDWVVGAGWFTCRRRTRASR